MTINHFYNSFTFYWLIFYLSLILNSLIHSYVTQLSVLVSVSVNLYTWPTYIILSLEILWIRGGC